jgi:tetratricopeptide (TPR) repeat protein
MPYLSWQTIVIGDPLCAPFRRTPLTAVQLHGGVEPETGIPVLYGERRLAVLKASGLDPDALKLTIQARAEQLRGNLDVVEALLVKATTIEPHLTSAHLGLALIFDESGRRDRAIVRYRRVLALHPRNLIALNNLAFALAVHKGAPQEALPLAKQAYAALHGNLQKEMSVSPEQAFTAAGDVPFVADTLGWILHLLGDDRAAAPFIDEALAAANSRHAEVLLHAAVVHAAIGQTEKARRELDAAVQLDPSLAETPAASKLRSTKD